LQREQNKEINMREIKSKFVATGSCIPKLQVSNADFASHQFLESNGVVLNKSNDTIIDRFKEITGIEKRCYAAPDQKASDLAFLSAVEALNSSGIDKETLDYIIVAQNFGDVAHQSNRTEQVPSLATRVKHALEIENPDCVAYDIIFGCPGWLQGVIQADYFIRSGDAKRCLVIGTETLSRVIDPHDRDSMLYGDGSGAVILEAVTNSSKGILAHGAQTYAGQYATLLTMSESYNPDINSEKDIYLKMSGRKLYEFALNHVPIAIKSVLDKAGIHLREIKKVLIHQANEKMDAAILDRLYKLYDLGIPNKDIMPMTIASLGNSSVATVPTLLDLILKGKINHQIHEGDKVVLASVGAGMNINAVVYQF
jgi:3-oxoacyl-[acyl-carrier-protein] synthase III